MTGIGSRTKSALIHWPRRRWTRGHTFQKGGFTTIVALRLDSPLMAGRTNGTVLNGKAKDFLV